LATANLFKEVMIPKRGWRLPTPSIKLSTPSKVGDCQSIQRSLKFPLKLATKNLEIRFFKLEGKGEFEGGTMRQQHIG
jgi:hypothetical protein